jgi:hypothetical protein
MEINTKIKFVEGSFDTKTGELICVPHKKYGEVSLCFKSNMHVPFAKIKLHSEDLAVDADAVFEDAVKLGEEIVRRWNECQNPL